MIALAACGSATPAPTASMQPVPAPAPVVRIEPADLATFEVDEASGFEVKFEGNDYSVADVNQYKGSWSSKYKVWTWDPTWPTGVDAFAAKLAEPDFLDDSFRYEVTKTSATDDTWEFRGKRIYSGNNEAEPTFVVVRTINGKRFLCKGKRVEDTGALDAAIASCRGATLASKRWRR